MKDAFGRILEVGDQVAYVYGSRYLELSWNYVVRFSEARVYLADDMEKRGVARHPHRCIKLEAI